ncbi:MAG: hypothetical protein JSW41_01460 [Candidatus Aenigmatarchaeota archaeon]|nr:MAG: hypothetical protein JSW41_01460 [Candidatus Aenigmarchaeota archaeon]
MIKKFFEKRRINLFMKRARLAKRLLKLLDMRMEKLGWPNWKKKQFWRDFHKSQTLRDEIFNNLI